MSAVFAAIPLLALLALAPTTADAASAELVRAIDAIRSQGCGRIRGVESPLRQEPVLDRVAEKMATGQVLKDAMQAAGYRATQAATLEVSGSGASLERALARDGCKDIADPVYRDVGFAETAGSTWIVLAAPLLPPSSGEAESVSRRVLDLVNQVRQQSRRCGWTRFNSAAPLVLSESLHSTALAHARELAERSVLTHVGGDASTPAERATRAGYRWRVVGENIASGQATAEQVVDEWVASAHHCANLMDTDFTEMGVAYATDPQSKAGVYWVQMFAAPRR